MKKRIYLDYAASTPVDAGVLKEMAPYVKRGFGNASSLHSFGQEARAAIEKARETAARFLKCEPLEVIFMSGATEANNMAIFGIAKNFKQKIHIVTTQIEHESVLSPCQALVEEGIAEVTYVKPDTEGIVRPQEVQNALKENTILVSVMYTNSEIGTVQPVAEIGALVKELKTKNPKLKTLFHTDAVQAAQFLDCNVQKLGVDLLTLSSHKIYGPKGAGVLYKKEGVRLSPLIFGGGQEQGFRSGTENTQAIVGFGKALEELQHPRTQITNIRMRRLRDVLIKEIFKRISGAALSGLREQRLPNNVHVRFEGIFGKDLVIMLDQKGIAVSAGSACSEKTEEASHVLLAMGLEPRDALSGVRITLGKYTTLQEILKTAKTLSLCVDRLRKQQV